MRALRAALAGAALAASTAAQDGAIDVSLGGAGWVAAGPPGGVFVTGAGIAVRPDGRLIVAGQTYNGGQQQWNSYLARRLSSGAPDATYSGDGYAGFDLLTSGADDGLTAMLPLPDGRLVAGGYFERQWLFTRFTDTGELDPAFGELESVTRFTFGPTGGSRPNALLATEAGYVGAGVAQQFYGDLYVGDFAVARVTTAGLPDPGFNGGEAVVIDFTPNMDVAHGVIETVGGGLLIAGYAGVSTTSAGSVALARLLPDGSLDPTFLDGGRGVIDLLGGSALAYALAPGPGDTFYIGGTGGPESLLFVARLHTDGTPDSTFGGDGVATMPLPGSSTWGTAYALHVQPDGKVLAAGQGVDGPAIVRLLPDGTPDPQFGTDGATVTPVFDESRGIYGGDARMIAIQPNGRIVVGGTAHGDFGMSGFLLARYHCAVVTPVDPPPPAHPAAALAVVPNPVRGAASVHLSVEAPAYVRVSVQDLLGRELAVLHDGVLQPGQHALRLDTSRLPQGSYLVRAVGADLTQVHLMAVAR